MEKCEHIYVSKYKTSKYKTNTNNAGYIKINTYKYLYSNNQEKHVKCAPIFS